MAEQLSRTTLYTSLEETRSGLQALLGEVTHVNRKLRGAIPENAAKPLERDDSIVAIAEDIAGLVSELSSEIQSQHSVLGSSSSETAVSTSSKVAYR